MSRIYGLFEWISRIFFANILWITLNIPIIYLIISLIFVENTTQYIGIVMYIAIIAPFLFFPTTAALFAIVRKWIMNERDIPIFSSFWCLFKENYVKSLLAGIILEVIWFILIADAYYFMTYISDWFLYPFLLLFMFLSVFTLHVFSTIVHFNMKVFHSLKNAVFMTIGRPLVTFMIGIINIFIVYISITHMPFLIIAALGTITALVSFWGFYRIYLSVESLHAKEISES